MITKFLPAETRVLDEKSGIVEYIVSDESVDRQGEIIRLNGWRFDQMPKNAPLLDSHRYGSIDNLVGKVLDARLDNGALVETAQWAVDVPENELARRGWAMTKAGYLKGCSPGFFPVKLVTRLMPEQLPRAFEGATVYFAGTRTGKAVWEQQGRELQQNLSAVKTIYISQQQHELSVCILGANPNATLKAVAMAHRDGVLSEADFQWFLSNLRSNDPATVENRARGRENFCAAFNKALGRSGRMYSFPSSSPSIPQIQKTLDMNLNFLRKIDAATGQTKSQFDRLEAARRSGSDSELQLEVHKTLYAQALERQRAVHEPIEAFLNRNPEQRLLWSGIARFLGGGHATPDEMAVLKAWVPGDPNIGAGMFPIPVSPDLFDLLLIYGAFRDLGVRQLLGQYTRFAKVTSLPAVVVASPTYQGTYTIPADASLAGGGTYEAASTFACLLQISHEWLQDVKMEIASAVLGKLVPAMAKAIDFCAFQGTGDDDLSSGAMTGIFVDAAIANYAAQTVGKTNIAALDRSDFLNTIAAVAPAALQRPCRWYVHPAFIPQLMLLKDGPGDTYLLRSPARTGTSEWTLVDFPVTWTAQAPSVNQAGQKVAAFGEPSSYTVALRSEVEIMSSDDVSFAQVLRNVRAMQRGHAFTREATGFATLSLSKQ
jgi:hypothetical protein